MLVKNHTLKGIKRFLTSRTAEKAIVPPAVAMVTPPKPITPPPPVSYADLPDANSTSLKTTMIPGCCGLKTIHKLACIGKTDELSAKHAKVFDDLANNGKAQDGMWNAYGKAPETVAIITTSPRYNKMEEFKRQKKFLEDKKWVLLASWKSMESGGENYLYGSPGIKNL